MLLARLEFAVSGNNVVAAGPGQVPQHKAFTGRVTKLLDNFGFVDDDVFFQLSVVRGGNVKIGDQVYVDCQYSEHLPFKWNALCVQIIPQQASSVSTYLPQNNNVQQQQQQSQSIAPQQKDQFSQPSRLDQPYYREIPPNHQQQNHMQSQPQPQAQQQPPQHFVSDYKQTPVNQQNTMQPQSQNYQEDPRFYGKQTQQQNLITYTSTPGNCLH